MKEEKSCYTSISFVHLLPFKGCQDSQGEELQFETAGVDISDEKVPKDLLLESHDEPVDSVVGIQQLLAFEEQEQDKDYEDCTYSEDNEYTTFIQNGLLLVRLFVYSRCTASVFCFHLQSNCIENPCFDFVQELHQRQHFQCLKEDERILWYFDQPYEHEDKELEHVNSVPKVLQAITKA